ncbi:hypothetical protein ACJMK2_021150 [Sinanodonta woodiana]|uniref:Uncharacterized protein n=1 Tax=Sinanodonta woodiana TaxID=1069815 RepID=A0ABD3U452_SINWO
MECVYNIQTDPANVFTSWSVSTISRQHIYSIELCLQHPDRSSQRITSWSVSITPIQIQPAYLQHGVCLQHPDRSSQRITSWSVSTTFRQIQPVYLQHGVCLQHPDRSSQSIYSMECVYNIQTDPASIFTAWSVSPDRSS